MSDLKPISESFAAFVSHVTQEDNHLVLWVQKRVGDVLQFEAIYQQLYQTMVRQFFDRNRPKIDLVFGKYYLFCDRRPFIHFYRVLLLEEHMDRVHVFFVDFGYEESVLKSEVFKFDPIFENSVKPLAEKVIIWRKIRENEKDFKMFTKNVFLFEINENSKKVFDRNGLLVLEDEQIVAEEKMMSLAEEKAMPLAEEKETSLAVDLPKIEVFLSSIENNFVFIQRKDNLEELQKLNQKMDEIYGQQPKEAFERPAVHVGAHVAAKYVGSWFRAQIIEVKENGQVYVIYSDFGNKEWVSLDEDIRPIIDQIWREFPEFFAEKCFVLNELDFELEVCLIHEERLFAQFLSQKKKISKINLFLDESENNEEEEDTEEENPCVGDKEEDNQFMRSKNENKENREKVGLNDNQCLRNESKDNKDSNKEFEAEIRNLDSNHELVGKEEKVIICHTKSANHLFLQLSDNLTENLNLLEKNLIKSAENSPNLEKSPPQVGEIILIFDGFALKWRRGRVLNVTGQEVRAHLVDFGSEVSAILGDCRPLRDRSLRETPFLAIDCQLVDSDLFYYDLKRLESREAELKVKFLSISENRFNVSIIDML